MKKSEADLVGRAVVDTAFRQQLLADPDRVIAEEGYEVGDDLRRRIRDAQTATPAELDAAIAAASREGGVGS